MNLSNIKRYTGLIALVSILSVSGVPLAEAGCLNCSTNTQTENQVEENVSDEKESVSIPTSGSIRTKIRRLPDDPVKDFYIPVLLGVSLDDLYPNFGDARDGGSRSHEGFDILAPKGTPIVSPTVAVVTHIGTWSGAGKFVETANPGGERFIYMHLDAFGDELDTGDVLQVGDLVGYVGDTGNAYGGPAHLHLEVRDGRKALDPYPRITKEFSLKNTIRYLDTILDDHDDKKEFATFVVETFEPLLIQATTQKIALPERIANLLPDIADIAAPTARDLTLGMEGTDVSVLQSILIAEGHLDIAAPTGRFGPLTQQALKAYQTEHGITPATGYFGPTTRLAMTRGETKTTASVVSRPTEEVSLATIIDLFIALGIISKDKETAAREALRALPSA